MTFNKIVAGYYEAVTGNYRITVQKEGSWWVGTIKPRNNDGSFLNLYTDHAPSKRDIVNYELPRIIKRCELELN